MKRMILAAMLAAPATLMAQNFDDVEYTVVDVTDGIKMLQARGGNIGVSYGDDGVFLVDDQFAQLTGKLVATVASFSDQPIRFVVNTHWHGDHTGGNENLGEAGAVIVAHDNIRERMSADHYSSLFDRTTPASPEAALPEVTFNDKVTVHLNGDSVTAYHVHHAHTDGDSIIHFADNNVIHMGDIFFNGLYPFIDRDSGGSLQGMLAGVDFALSLCRDGTQVIPGHGPLTDCNGLSDYRDLLTGARDRVAALRDQGMSLEQTIAAQPNRETDEALGGAFITPEQFVQFIYRSLEQPPEHVGRP